MRSFLWPWCAAAVLVLATSAVSRAQYSVWPTQNPLVTYNYAPATTSSYVVDTNPYPTSVTTGWTYPSYTGYAYSPYVQTYPSYPYAYSYYRPVYMSYPSYSNYSLMRSWRHWR